MLPSCVWGFFYFSFTPFLAPLQLVKGFFHSLTLVWMWRESRRGRVRCWGCQQPCTRLQSWAVAGGSPAAHCFGHWWYKAASNKQEGSCALPAPFHGCYSACVLLRAAGGWHLSAKVSLGCTATSVHSDGLGRSAGGEDRGQPEAAQWRHLLTGKMLCP